MTSENAAYTQTRWSLAELLPGGSQDVDPALDRLDQAVAAFESHRSDLSPEISTGAFLDMIREFEDLSRQAHVLNSFAGLWFAEDTQNQAAQTLSARVDQFMAEMQN